MVTEQERESTTELREGPDPGDTRALILHTATALFLEHGYAAVSMSQIVDEVSKVRKLSKPAIYYHFADKKALFMAVVLDVLERGGRAITAAGATEGDLATRVAALARTVTGGHGFMNFRTSLSEFDQEDLKAFGRARSEYLFGPLVAAFARFAEQGELRADIAPATAALSLMGITHTLTASGQHTELPGEIGAMAADILLHGVAAPPGGHGRAVESDPDG